MDDEAEAEAGDAVMTANPAVPELCLVIPTLQPAQFVSSLQSYTPYSLSDGLHGRYTI